MSTAPDCKPSLAWIAPQTVAPRETRSACRGVLGCWYFGGGTPAHPAPARTDGKVWTMNRPLRASGEPPPRRPPIFPRPPQPNWPPIVDRKPKPTGLA
jgi:hypothetical protein